jgi:protein involved in polysaccharide export with SLBB domain
MELMRLKEGRRSGHEKVLLACVGLLCMLMVSVGARGQEIDADSQLQYFGYEVFRLPTEEVRKGPVDKGYVLSPGDEVIIDVWGELDLNYQVTVTEDGFFDIPDDVGRIFVNGLTLEEVEKAVLQRLSSGYATYFDPATPSSGKAYLRLSLGKIQKLLVYVSGEVVKPGTYSVTASAAATVINILSLAGGARERGSLRSIEITRSNARRETIDLYNLLLGTEPDLEKHRIRFGDMIAVPIRLNSVAIQGEMKRPGIYELKKQEGLHGLIDYAGGFTPRASLSNVQIRRIVPYEGEEVLRLDLRDLVQSKERDFALMDGDVITVFPLSIPQKEVAVIRGDGIFKPGTYEYHSPLTLLELIARAGGLKGPAVEYLAEITRTTQKEGGEVTSLQTLNLRIPHDFLSRPDKKAFLLQNLDRIHIRRWTGFPELTVKMRGAGVTYPGSYSIGRPGETLTELIDRGGGLREGAHLEGAILIRNDQRVIIDLKAASAGNEGSDLTLRDGDLLWIGLDPQTVRVEGAVIKPAVIQYRQAETLDYYVSLCGGYQDNAEMANVTVEFADGSVERVKRGLFRSKTVVPRSGSTIRVPEKTQETFEETPSKRL